MIFDEDERGSRWYLSSYSFYADPLYAETSLVIVRAKTHGEFKDVWLECAGTLTGWKPIGNRGQYEFVRSEGAFTATLWGWDDFASYAYPGGMAQRKLVDSPLLPVH